MKIGEILRQLADVVDAEDSEDDVTTDQAPDFKGQAGTGESPDDVMVPPLQQKHELLKKATGVENNVDQFCHDDPDMDDLKKMAGIPQQAPAPVPAPPAEPIVIKQTLEIPAAGQAPTQENVVQPDFTQSAAAHKYPGAENPEAALIIASDTTAEAD